MKNPQCPRTKLQHASETYVPVRLLAKLSNSRCG